MSVLQAVDTAKADLLRAEVLGTTKMTPRQPANPQSAPLLQSAAKPLENPPLDTKLPHEDRAQNVLPNQAVLDSSFVKHTLPQQAASKQTVPKEAGALPEHAMSSAALANIPSSKKRKADKAGVTAEAGAAAEEAVQAVAACDVPCQQAGQEAAVPNQATAVAGDGKKMKKQGTLQAAFAKAKVLICCCHLPICLSVMCKASTDSTNCLYASLLPPSQMIIESSDVSVQLFTIINHCAVSLSNNSAC